MVKRQLWLLIAGLMMTESLYARSVEVEAPVELGRLTQQAIRSKRRQPTPRLLPRSFLVKPVWSVRELVEQIRKEPKVARRYERHFGIDAEWLADYFEKNLKLKPLSKSGTYLMYYYDEKKDKIGVRRSRLRKGSFVFVTADGTPVLFHLCGNPLTSSLPIRAAPAAKPAWLEAMVLKPTPEMAPSLSLEPGLAEVAPEVVTAPVVSELELPPIAELPPEGLIPVSDPAGAALLPPKVEALRRPLPWFILLPPLAGGGGGPEPIPEPSAGLALLAGIGWLYGQGWTTWFRKSKALSSPSRKNSK